jgi:hypothetical protein
VGYIADLSRYDPVEAVDGFPDGVILNVEDPGFADKRSRAVGNGIPWGTYSWVYPGQGAAAAQRAYDAGVGPLGTWLDYEQDGVTPTDLEQALAKADELGLHLGVYTYLATLPSVASLLGKHPLWLAYYPMANDGTYLPGYSDSARQAGALLHQFTSSNGFRDLSVVLDPARWATWTGTAPAPAPTTSEFCDMLYKTTDNGVDTYYRDAGGILVKLSASEAGVYYPAIAAGKLVVVTLGGGLAALAYNANTVKAQKAAGQP